MDYRLRKRHKWMWLTLTPLLAFLLFLSAKNLDFFPTKEPFQMNKVEGNVVQEIENTQMKVILSNTSQQYLLNIWVKTPLKSTSSVVYEIDANGKIGSTLGQLEGEGGYVFSSNTIINGFVVIDEIKNQQILKMEF